MPNSTPLDPAASPEPALARPETPAGRAAADASPAGPAPLPSPPADDAPSVVAGSVTLHTDLLGPLTLADAADRAAELAELSRRAALYATRARGDGTRRAYRSAWRHYEAWCVSLGRAPLGANADTIAMYVVRLADAGLAVSSIASPSPRSRPPTCWPARRSICAIPASPWCSRASPVPKACDPAARPPRRYPTCCA